MKPSKQVLASIIEEHVAHGVTHGEEVDVVTSKLMSHIWPFFEFVTMDHPEKATKAIEEMATMWDELEEFGGFKALFSDDENTNRMAKVRLGLRDILFMSSLYAIKDVEYVDSTILSEGEDCGRFVVVRPVGEEETHLGIYLGEIVTGASSQIDGDTIKISLSRGNPLMYIPDLKKTIKGLSSWWSFIKSPEDLRQITDHDIENVWYVKALNQLSKDEGNDG